MLSVAACSDDPGSNTKDKGISPDRGGSDLAVVQDKGADRGQLDGSGLDGSGKDVVTDVVIKDDGTTIPKDGSAGENASKVLCNPSLVTCQVSPSPCSSGQAPQIIAGCWGPCVPISQCTDLPSKPDCNTSQGIICDVIPPSCPKHYTPTRSGACYGPCVPLTACACATSGPPEQCPDPQYICHNTGFCGVIGP
ncbi:MAG: hypothetical protein CSA24_00430 [Deltaproteobacteria bacterium]|nr:MAG: hypothetical protein CSA24_00430 [Deltaproteobacteria bacterium]